MKLSTSHSTDVNHFRVVTCRSLIHTATNIRVISLRGSDWDSKVWIM